MIGYLREIEVRRQRLVARSDAERAALGTAAQPLASAVRIADAAVALARAAAGAAAAYSIARRIARWASASR